MITPKLEQMIHEGTASARTFVCGVSGNTALKVPDGKYIVIHNICYFPFFNIQEDNTAQFDYEKIKRATKQVQFRSQKSDNHFIFRDSGLTTLVPIILDTYMVHFDDVAISFLQVPRQLKANINFAVQKISSVILKSPRGYGGLGAVSRIDIQAGMRYVPVPAFLSGEGTPASYRDEYKIDHTPQTQLFNPTGVDTETQCIDRSLPLLNIQYVLINKSATDKVQASS